MKYEDYKEFSEKVRIGVEKAIKDLRDKTKKEGGYLVVSNNGKIEKIPAEKL
jgi:hypothetical protein